MRAPEGLGDRGRALWRSVVGGLPAGWELDERERAILRLAADQADDVARLERALAEASPVVVGSSGQPRVHPALGEARQGRLAVGRLLGQLALPDEAAEPLTEAGRRGRRAARARWDRRDWLVEGVRGGKA